MLSPRTLRGRLTIAYAAALAAALIAFAALALTVLDATQRVALDAQLATMARASEAIVDTKHGRLSVDANDRVQFETISSGKAASAVFRDDGTVLMSTTAVPRAVAARAREASASVYQTLSAEGGERLYDAPIIVRGRRLGTIAVWRDVGSIGELDRSVGLAFALAIPIFVGVATLSGSAIARRALAPLERMAVVASEIEATDLSRRLGPAGDGELGRFAAIFDRMLDRLQQAFERERRFTSDASHELRAPLSVIRVEAELALRKERSSAEYCDALATIADEVDALETLTEDLLAAARAEELPGELAETVDLAATADHVAQRLSLLAAERGVRIVRNAIGAAHVAGNPDRLARAVMTVTHNAVRYAREGGTVEIRVAGDGARVDLLVRDDGPGFSDAALRHATERFWRDDDDARAAGGTGLGLAIARAIVEQAKGTITLANAPGGGALVQLSFPAQPPGGASSS